MLADYIGGIRSIDDYKRAKQQFDLDKQLKQEQLRNISAKRELATRPKPKSIKQIGEQAFLKAGQGMELTPEEQAAAKYLDAKSGGMQFDPVSGAMVQKPSLFSKIPIGDMSQQVERPTNANSMQAPQELLQPPQKTMQILPDTVEETPFYEKQYQGLLEEGKDNPKMLQSIRSEFSKARLAPKVDEKTAYGFALRMRDAEQVLSNPEAVEESKSLKNIAIQQAPYGVGNFFLSPEYQKFDQAKRNFINAQLRRESGAVISPEEFDNANKQYFPMPGDSPEVIEQKRINRQSAFTAMQASAGAAFEGELTNPSGQGESIDDIIKKYTK